MADDVAKNPVRVTLGENVARIRHTREMTVRDLAAKLVPLGLKLSPSGVSEIENAGRKVSVDELLVIAIALNASIIDLLLPDINERLKIAEGIEPITQLSLAEWLGGRLVWPPGASREDFTSAARGSRKAALQANEAPSVKAVARLASMMHFSEMFGMPPGNAAKVLRDALADVDREVGAVIADYDELVGDGG